jgi:hypothetical protein
MTRLLLILNLALTLFITTPLLAADGLALLETAAQSQAPLQQGLDRYQVTVETTKIVEMIGRMTSNMPPNLPRPAAPKLTKYWQSQPPRSLVIAEGETVNPYVQQMVERFSNTLAVELEGLLLPADQSEQRSALAATATMKTAETTLAEQRLNRIELTFSDPVNLNGAFYNPAIRLPQKQIKALTFDINADNNTLNEMVILTADGLTLTVEIRYHQIEGSDLPQRLKVTSPDGSIDDLFEVTFEKVDDFSLPSRMVRTLRRPDLSEDLEVSFKDYKINPSFPDSIRNRLQTAP